VARHCKAFVLGPAWELLRWLCHGPLAAAARARPGPAAAAAAIQPLARHGGPAGRRSRWPHWDTRRALSRKLGSEAHGSSILFTMPKIAPRLNKNRLGDSLSVPFCPRPEGGQKIHSRGQNKMEASEVDNPKPAIRAPLKFLGRDEWLSLIPLQVNLVPCDDFQTGN
jgi:hypothetical protein